MVERTQQLDAIFGSLSDSTRRDILRRVAQREQSVGELAKRYDISLAAVSKHLGVLERAELVEKRRRGKQQLVRMQPRAVELANRQLERYRKLWDERFDRLEQILEREGEDQA